MADLAEAWTRWDPSSCTSTRTLALVELPLANDTDDDGYGFGRRSLISRRYSGDAHNSSSWPHYDWNFLYFISNHFFMKQARWPSGLRRQLKVLPIRWSERAWVQIPLSSISFCSLCHYLKLQKGGGMGQKSTF
jgi:hypothetical protein